MASTRGSSSDAGQARPRRLRSLRAAGIRKREARRGRLRSVRPGVAGRATGDPGRGCLPGREPAASPGHPAPAGNPWPGATGRADGCGGPGDRAGLALPHGRQLERCDRAERAYRPGDCTPGGPAGDGAVPGCAGNAVLGGQRVAPDRKPVRHRGHHAGRGWRGCVPRVGCRCRRPGHGDRQSVRLGRRLHHAEPVVRNRAHVPHVRRLAGSRHRCGLPAVAGRQRAGRRHHGPVELVARQEPVCSRVRGAGHGSARLPRAGAGRDLPEWRQCRGWRDHRRCPGRRRGGGTGAADHRPAVPGGQAGAGIDGVPRFARRRRAGSRGAGAHARRGRRMGVHPDHAGFGAGRRAHVADSCARLAAAGAFQPAHARPWDHHGQCRGGKRPGVRGGRGHAGGHQHRCRHQPGCERGQLRQHRAGRIGWRWPRCGCWLDQPRRPRGAGDSSRLRHCHRRQRARGRPDGCAHAAGRSRVPGPGERDQAGRPQRRAAGGQPTAAWRGRDGRVVQRADADPDDAGTGAAAAWDRRDRSPVADTDPRPGRVRCHAAARRAAGRRGHHGRRPAGGPAGRAPCRGAAGCARRRGRQQRAGCPCGGPGAACARAGRRHGAGGTGCHGAVPAVAVHAGRAGARPGRPPRPDHGRAPGRHRGRAGCDRGRPAQRRGRARRSRTDTRTGHPGGC